MHYTLFFHFYQHHRRQSERMSTIGVFFHWEMTIFHTQSSVRFGCIVSRNTSRLCLGRANGGDDREFVIKICHKNDTCFNRKRKNFHKPLAMIARACESA